MKRKELILRLRENCLWWACKVFVSDPDREHKALAFEVIMAYKEKNDK